MRFNEKSLARGAAPKINHEGREEHEVYTFIFELFVTFEIFVVRRFHRVKPLSMQLSKNFAQAR